ncbi:hypothetical protein LINGRAHAP2_LOCUS31670, partial [Linum grandiflorum]
MVIGKNTISISSLLPDANDTLQSSNHTITMTEFPNPNA